MLHTLNKAWVKILVNQALKDCNKRFLFICDENNSEAEMVFNLLPTDKILDICVINYKIAKNMPNINLDIPKFDDILVSHEIHDMFLKDYLHKHLKRKCC